MMDCIYYCTNNEDNNCPKKNECKRFINTENKCVTTLYKSSCTEDNDYILFIKHDGNLKEETN